MNKSQIWVSAAIYMALGVIVITIVLAATMPLLQNLKDKNTFIQTRNLLFSLDQTIRETFEGPGSQREFFLEIREGELIINSETDNITWEMKTSAKLVEPGITIKEGNLKKLAETTNIEGQYKLTLNLPYKDIVDIQSEPEIMKIKGSYNLIIRNLGEQVISIKAS